MKRFLVTFIADRIFVPLVVLIAVFGAVDFFYALPHLPTSIVHFALSVVLGLVLFVLPFLAVYQWKREWEEGAGSEI